MQQVQLVHHCWSQKYKKYALLSRFHHFVPIAIETYGALGPDALSLFIDIGRCQQAITHDHQSLSFLLQRVSIALQQGNAASVLGTSKYYVIYIVYPCIYVYMDCRCLIYMSL